MTPATVTDITQHPASRFTDSRVTSHESRLSTRMYAAAKVSRQTGDWQPINQDINTLLRSSADVIRARSRQLVRDFAYFARAVQILVDYTVGAGVRLNAQVRRKNGEYNIPINRAIEDAWKRWLDEADASGRLHYHELEQLAKRQDVEAGEFLLVKVDLPDKGRFLPFALQAYEADWLSSSYATPGDRANFIDQGVEFNAITGRVAAYHFQVPNGYGILGTTKAHRVPVENVIHGFQTLRPGQLRGISPFTTAILVANDLHDYLGAEIDGAKSAAKWLAFVETADPEAFQALRAVTGPDGVKKIEDLENATIEYLRPGEKITLGNSNRPGDSFAPFCKMVLRMIAISKGVPYEMLSGDYDGISYSNLRGIRNDFAYGMRPEQNRHLRQFCNPVYAAFLESAVKAGRINLPEYWADPWRYTSAAVWQTPGMESIDPLREGKAWIEQIAAGLRSPQEITAARGRDFEEVAAEIAEAKRLFEDKGIPWPYDAKVSTALKTNPAAQGAPET